MPPKQWGTVPCLRQTTHFRSSDGMEGYQDDTPPLIEFETGEEDFLTWAKRQDAEDGYHVDYDKAVEITRMREVVPKAQRD